MVRYDNMTETQARFFAKWLPKLRPKLNVLESSQMSNLTTLVINDGLSQKLERWRDLPLDSDCFLNFLFE